VTETPVLPPVSVEPEPQEDLEPRRPRWPVRLAGAALACALLLGAAAAVLGHAYRDSSRRADRNAADAATLRQRVSALEGQLAAARLQAGVRYRSGVAAGLARAQKPGSLLLGYPQGYADGYRDAFAGFPRWPAGWYLVEVGRSRSGPHVVSRFPVSSCQSVFVHDGQPYHAGNGCAAR
jgi:hypothetical protein